MAVPLAPDTIEAVANRIAAGERNGVIAEAMGLTRSALAGIIFRPRQRGDARVPPAGATPIVTKAEQRDALAEAFAEGAATLADAARIARVPQQIAVQRWSEICTQLGRQAR